MADNMGDRVSRYSREYIERRTELALRAYVPDALRTAQPTPLHEIVTCVKRDLHASFHFDSTLGTNSRGDRILGACYFAPRFAIFVDASLNGDPHGARFRFTLAHELGHLSLHRRLRLDFQSLDSTAQAIIDSERDIEDSPRILETPRHFLEWQANAYAVALLMPRATFVGELKRQQEDMGITRSGYVYLTDQPSSRFDYRHLIDRLRTTYQTSSTATRFRLVDLNLVQDRRMEASRGSSTATMPAVLSAAVQRLLSERDSPSEEEDDPDGA